MALSGIYKLVSRVCCEPRQRDVARLLAAGSQALLTRHLAGLLMLLLCCLARGGQQRWHVCFYLWSVEGLEVMRLYAHALRFRHLCWFAMLEFCAAKFTFA